MARNRRRYTIYDMMDEKGIFESNPANTDSRSETGESLYEGPVPYPKMLYHPQGEEIVVTPAEIIVTPLGPKAVGEQRQLVYRVVQSEAEEKELVELGWHTHPAKAIAASGRAAPAMGSDARIAELEAQIARQQLELDAARSVALADAKASQQTRSKVA